MAEVRLANLRPASIEANATARISLQSLNNLIGLPEHEKVKLNFEMDSTLYLIPELDLDSLKTASLKNRPEFNMIELEKKMRKKAISIARAGYRPKIDFSSSLQFQAQYDQNKWPERDMWARSSFSSLNISIPIFDSWETPSKVKQAKLDYIQAELSEKEISENLMLELEQAWWNYQKARESLAAIGQAVQMAKRSLDIARVRYENGVSTQLELFESEVALAASETNRVKAFYDLITGFAALRKAMGEENLLK